MSWGWVFSLVVAMIGAAILAELWLRRGTRRPLSRHAVNQRRWSDPERRRHQNDEAIIESGRALGRFGTTGTRRWRFPRDPHEQARALIPARARKKGKDND